MSKYNVPQNTDSDTRNLKRIVGDTSMPDDTLTEILISEFGFKKDDLVFRKLLRTLTTYFDSRMQGAVNEATVRTVADLAECLGVLRGLGHPNETLEAKYELKKGEADGS